ncbi:MAG: LysR family transcriptional regulator [Acidisphaera sp.]|nr:LysR family transcriptional regulator [Acidisphaera sp.]
MVDSLSRLPRLAGLLMFETAARNESFTLAARDLKVTPAAVSQQVRALERELGVALFTRLQRGLALTQDGRRLHRAVAMAFEHIAGVADEVRKPERSPALSIGVTFAIASFWLVPRLPQFRARHPEIDVRVVASDGGFPAIANQIDAGIAYGNGRWPGFSATLLREGVVFPVCSPEYLRGRAKLRHVEQLLGETLLSLETDRADLFDWPVWFASHGVRGYAGHRNLKFNSHPLLLQAACAGQGVALGWSLLADDLLQKRVLVRPIDAALRAPKSYYFVVAENRLTAETLAFRNWLLDYFQDRPALPGELPARYCQNSGTKAGERRA